MTKKRDRFFALFGAILFLVTASTLTIAVIYQMATQDNSSANSDTNSSSKTLQGTQLAGFTPTSDVPTLQVIDTKVGTGAEVKSGDVITADYTGAVASTGTIFQSSLDSGQPFSAQAGIGQLIKGWDEGIPGMKVGGVRRLVIPADLAYGATPPAGSGIPANAPLVFDITLHSIGQ